MRAHFVRHGESGGQMRDMLVRAASRSWNLEVDDRGKYASREFEGGALSDGEKVRLQTYQLVRFTKRTDRAPPRTFF